GDAHVAHVPAVVDPPADGAGAAELDVVGVGADHHGPANVVGFTHQAQPTRAPPGERLEACPAAASVRSAARSSPGRPGAAPVGRGAHRSPAWRRVGSGRRPWSGPSPTVATRRVRTPEWVRAPSS